MLYREIIAVCSEIHTKHINTAVWVEPSLFFSVKPGGTYSNHWALERQGAKTAYDAIERVILDNKGRVRYNDIL